MMIPPFKQQRQRKANVWVIEFIIAIVLFTLLAMLFVNFSKSFLEKAQPKSEQLLQEANSIAENLLYVGIPDNWVELVTEEAVPGVPDITSDSDDLELVSSIGIMDDDGVNLSIIKLIRFGQWTHESQDYYTRTKGKLGIRSNYIVFFENRNEELVDFRKNDPDLGIFYGDIRFGAQDWPASPEAEFTSVEELDAKLSENGVRNLIKTYRYVFYRETSRKKGELLRMAIYLW